MSVSAESYLPSELLDWFINTPAILLILLLSDVCKELLNGENQDRALVIKEKTIEMKENVSRKHRFSHLWMNPFFHNFIDCIMSGCLLKDSSSQIQNWATFALFYV